MTLHRDKSVFIGVALTIVLAGAMALKGRPETVMVGGRSGGPEQPPLAVGSSAPGFALATEAGDSVGVGALGTGESVVVFVTPSCPYCRELKEELLTRGLPEIDRQIVFVSGSAADSTELPEVAALDRRLAEMYPLVVDTSGVVFEGYRAWTVPTLYRIDDRARVAERVSGVNKGLAMIDEFVRHRAVAAGRALKEQRP